jgi:hypothetical protein
MGVVFMNICAIRMIEEMEKRLRGRSSIETSLPHEPEEGIRHQSVGRYSFGNCEATKVVKTCKHCACLYSEDE